MCVRVWEYNVRTRQHSAKSSAISPRQQLLNGKLCQLIRKAVTLRSAHSVPVCTKLYECACLCLWLCVRVSVCVCTLSHKVATSYC